MSRRRRKKPYYLRRTPEQIAASKKRRDRRRYLRKKATRIPGEVLTIAALLERDGPICHLCGVEVDTTVHYNHPMAPTRDHVLALARQGTDTLDNLRIAHRSCNSKRKARKC